MSGETIQQAWLRRGRTLENYVADRYVAWLASAPELPAPARLVFVCRGNICRSAFAEAYLRKASPTLDVVSAGLETDPGTPPPGEACRAARALGVDLEGHRSRSLPALEQHAGDVFFVMEPWQARAAVLGPARDAGRAHLLALWLRPPRAAIADPLGGPPEAYDRCFRSVMAAAERILDGLPRTAFREAR
jgi:protein-tyrosine phosphatase